MPTVPALFGALAVLGVLPLRAAGVAGILRPKGSARELIESSRFPSTVLVPAGVEMGCRSYFPWMACGGDTQQLQFNQSSLKLPLMRTTLKPPGFFVLT